MAQLGAGFERLGTSAAKSAKFSAGIGSTSQGECLDVCDQLSPFLDAVLSPIAMVVGSVLLVWHVLIYFRILRAMTARVRENIALAWRMYFWRRS
jgi:hypothetical protein